MAGGDSAKVTTQVEALLKEAGNNPAVKSTLEDVLTYIREEGGRKQSNRTPLAKQRGVERLIIFGGDKGKFLEWSRKVMQFVDEVGRIEPCDPAGPGPVDNVCSDALSGERSARAHVPQLPDNRRHFIGRQCVHALGAGNQLMTERKILDQRSECLNTELREDFRAARTDTGDELNGYVKRNATSQERILKGYAAG